MSFRELSMFEVEDLLRRKATGQSIRGIARATGLDRKTVRRYLEAQAAAPEGTSGEEALALAVLASVQQRSTPAASEARRRLLEHRARIEAWLKGGEGQRPLRLVRIHELLAREGVSVSYSSLRRFARAEFGFGVPSHTVRVDDPPPGEEAQVDFGYMGLLSDGEGKMRRLHVLIVTLSRSRYQFVYPTFTQKVEDVCAGLDAAWRFFGGVPKHLVIDNATAMIVRAHPTDPTPQNAFREYARLRGCFIDAARVRHPKDKPRVENQVAYVRERWFDGERFLDLADARRSAEVWSREVAGTRVHGTTRQVPREVYEREERGQMLPPPTEPFDTPRWAKAKLHPDHHVQVQRALYSAPTRYIGKVLTVRIDTRTVQLFDGAHLIKMHVRQAPGGRSTDSEDYPKEKSAYALRSVDAIIRRAAQHGTHVHAFAERLLSGPLPWTRMRQGYALLRLCDRFGAARVDELCRRAIAFEVIEVARLERMLKTAAQAEEAPLETGRLIPLPARFSRSTETFATRPTRDTEAQEGGRS